MVTSQEFLYRQLQSRRHVIWDWNGTLLNDVDLAIATMNTLLGRRDLPQLDKKHYQNIFRFPVRLYYDDLGFDFQSESFEDVCHEFVSAYMEGFSSCTLVDGMASLVQRLHNEGMAQSILSATDQQNLDRMVQHHQLGPFLWKAFGIADKMGSSKEARGHELMETIDCDPSGIVLVGDTDHDWEVGKALGIDVILVTHGHQSREVLLKSRR